MSLYLSTRRILPALGDECRLHSQNRTALIQKEKLPIADQHRKSEPSRELSLQIPPALCTSGTPDPTARCTFSLSLLADPLHDSQN